MNLFKKIFGKKDESANTPIKSHKDFWRWFEKHHEQYFKVVKNQNDIAGRFVTPTWKKLQALNDGLHLFAGMPDEHTVEMIITADADPCKIVYAEELVAEAPKIEGWQFTPLKPSTAIKDSNIQIHGLKFNRSNLSFYAINWTEYPDEVDLRIVHADWNLDQKDEFEHGCHLFLDTHLGELEYLENIDKIHVIGPEEATEELIPIDKLKSYLKWRKKEFLEKYDGMSQPNNDNDHAIMSATTQSGHSIIASIDIQLLQWDGKASHPWILAMEIAYDGSNKNGLPEKVDSQRFYQMEGELAKMMAEYKDELYLGRETVNGLRTIFYACKDYRVPSKLADRFVDLYSSEYTISFSIYKDKYWRSMEGFIPSE